MSDIESDIEVEDPCAQAPITQLGLRVGAIFVILVTSLVGTLFPIAAKRVPWLRRIVPGIVFEFAKFFGSGVILATGFIHLLAPAATEALSEGNTISEGGCIPDVWGSFPYAFLFCLVSLFLTFVVQLVAVRLGTEKLKKLGICDAAQCCPDTGTHQAWDIDVEQDRGKDGPQHIGNPNKSLEKVDSSSSSEVGWCDAQEDSPFVAQILGVATLEFGVLFHSVIIGLTLALTGSDEFQVIFIVIVFHQMFEGLGLGARLAFLRLPSHWSFVPYTGALAYSLMTPIGMAVGLAVRETLSMSSGSGLVASGIIDSISAGILIYNSTVELMAHEFIFNKTFLTCSWSRLWFAVGSFGFGAGIMTLLAKWA